MTKNHASQEYDSRFDPKSAALAAAVVIGCLVILAGLIVGGLIYWGRMVF